MTVRRIASPGHGDGAGPANRCLDMPSTPNLRARVRRPIIPAMAELDQIYCYPVLVYLANPRGRPVDTDINAGADYVSFADVTPILLTSINSLADLRSAR